MSELTSSPTPQTTDSDAEKPQEAPEVRPMRAPFEGKNFDAIVAGFERMRDEIRSRPDYQPPPADTPDEAWPSRPLEQHFQLRAQAVTDPHNHAVRHTLSAHHTLTCTRCIDGMLQVRDERGYSFMRPCRCEPWHRRAELLNRAGLPSAALHHSLKDLDLNRVNARREIPQTTQQQQFDLQDLSQGRRAEAPQTPTSRAQGPLGAWPLMDEIERVLAGGIRDANARSWRTGLLLHGTTGTGKTHALQGLALKLILEAGRKVRWIHWPTWLERYKAAMGRGAHETTKDVFALITHAPILILDELGAEQRSEFSQARLEDVINHAEESLGRVTLLITSNFSPEALAKAGSARAMSRLYGLCEVVELVGGDYRRLG